MLATAAEACGQRPETWTTRCRLPSQPPPQEPLPKAVSLPPSFSLLHVVTKMQTRKGGWGRDSHKESTQQFPPVDLGLTLAALEVKATPQGHKEQIRYGGGTAMAGPTAFQPSPGRCHSTTCQQGEQLGAPGKGSCHLPRCQAGPTGLLAAPRGTHPSISPPLTEASSPPLGKLSRAIFQKSLFLSAWTGPVL